MRPRLDVGAVFSALEVVPRVMEAFVRLRVPGDVVFAVGAALLAVYALPLLRRPGQPQLELRSAAAK